MATSENTIGRAKAVLVFGEGDQARAVVSSVVVRAQTGKLAERVRFGGSVGFVPAVALHVREVLVPVTDQLLKGLGLRPRTYEIAIVNLAAASAADIGAMVSGFSADVPLLLALLSASLHLPVPHDLVATGHVASPAGDIRAVKAIPAKLAAAAADKSIQRFVYPHLDRDLSLRALTPAEYQRAAQAILHAADKFKLIGVSSVVDLLKATFEDQAIVRASLRHGFFDKAGARRKDSGLLAGALQFLTAQNPDRFWTALEHHMLAGQNREAQSLLLARAAYQIRRKRYPQGLGQRLLHLVRSLPPATRRLKLKPPLLPIGHCIRLSQFAGAMDHEDVQALLDATAGRLASHRPLPAVDRATHSCTGDAATLEAILSEISAEALASTIGLTIDAARASYALDSVTVESYEEFNGIIRAFQLHLYRHVYGGMLSADSDAVASEATDLLARAFARRGGLEAARAEAMEGTQGGLRRILDLMTEQFRAEQQAKHVGRVLREAMDPLDWHAKVALIQALLDKLGPALPPELRSAPPGRFARRWDELVRAYVQSLDHMKQVIRAF